MIRLAICTPEEQKQLTGEEQPGKLVLAISDGDIVVPAILEPTLDKNPDLESVLKVVDEMLITLQKQEKKA